LRITDRQIVRGVVDAPSKGFVEPLELIEHPVQAARDGAELVTPVHHRPRAQIPGLRLLHGPQDGAKRPSQHSTDRQVDENGDEYDSGDREPERDAQGVSACLEQTLQTDRDGHGVILTPRDR
jgi:hypothetical protein